MELLNELYERVEKELWELTHGDCWYPWCAEAAYHLTQTLKNIKEIEKLGEV